MRHSNGEPVAKIYTHDTFSTKETQGPIVNFNLLKSDGRFVGYGEVEQMAELYNIQLRTGCFCNQGACQIYLHLSDDQLLANLEVCTKRNFLNEGSCKYYNLSRNVIDYKLVEIIHGVFLLFFYFFYMLYL